MIRGPERIGYQVRYTSRPAVTRAMRIAIQDLGLDRLDIVYPGKDCFPLGDNIRAVGLPELVQAAR